MIAAALPKLARDGAPARALREHWYASGEGLAALASGKLTRADYKEVLEPVLREAAEAGEIRMVFELTGFKGLEPAAWYQGTRWR